jgi:aminoglycoside phosphotransferase (APT) family kinase protein
MTTPAGLPERLRPWLAQRLDDPGLAISQWRRHAEGFSWQTYTLLATWRWPDSGVSTAQRFAVRVEPADGMLDAYDIEGQYRLQSILSETDVPVPAVRWLEMDPGVVGRPFYVMDHVDGHVPVQWRPDDSEIAGGADAWHRFGTRFADVQAHIHTLDWRALGLGFLAAGEDPEGCAQAELERWVACYDQAARIEVPMVRQAIEWLRHHLRPGGPLVLCHGDYRIGNVIERDGELVGVLDWELAHIGDPIEDLAYTGLPLWRGRDPRLSHFLAPGEYFARYEARTGLAVDEDAYRAWTVFGLVKAAACHLRGVRAFADRRTSDLRLAAMDHQIAHLARHLLAVLDPGGD